MNQKESSNDNNNPQQEKILLDLAKDPEEQISDKFEDHVATSSASEDKNKLDTDVYNMMMVSPFLKNTTGRFGFKPISDTWFVGLFVFFIQIMIGSLIIVDIVMDGDAEGYNRKGFHPPLRIDPNVRAGQVFTLILALLMQNDVSSAIWNIYNLNFCCSREWVKVLIDEDKQDRVEEDVELLDHNLDEVREEEQPSLSTWIIRILVPNALKLLQGLLVLFATWLVIVDSDNFVDLIKDFTALFVVSSIDEVFFLLANHNFLSHDISMRTQAMDDIYFSTSHIKCCSLSVTMLSFALLTYVIFGVIMFSSFAVVANRQDEGDYLRERYPLCTENIKDISKLLDGVCHSQFNNRICEYDLGDCREFNSKYPNCRVSDPWRVGDGKCDLLHGYNVSACNFDGGDCLDLSCEEICNVSFKHKDSNHSKCLSLCKSNMPAKYPACKEINLISDGVCSSEYNSPECGYDAGDCIHLNNEINRLSNEINRVYPACELKNKNVFLFKNGVCNDEFNSAECGFDGGDCSQAMGVDLRERYPLCTMDVIDISKLGNGVCDYEFNKQECGFDDGDCLLINELYPSCNIEGKDTSLLGNGICNAEFNYEICGYDHGDCLHDFETFHAIYPSCELEGKDVSLLREKDCHEIFNSTACGYDNGACTSHCRPPDGKCQAEYNHLECAFDMGDCTTLLKTLELVGENSGDSFGDSISMSADGSILAVGASTGEHKDNTTGNQLNQGWVKVYKRNEYNEMIPYGSTIYGDPEDDLFGYNLSLSPDGSTLAVATYNPNRDDGECCLYGRVTVYRYDDEDNNDWLPIGSSFEGSNRGNLLGKSLSLSYNGNIIAIGGNSNVDIGGNSQGEVYQFDNNSKEWERLGEAFDEPISSKNFVSLSSDGFLLAIGTTQLSPGPATSNVKVYKYIEDSFSGQWIEYGNEVFFIEDDDEIGSMSLSSEGNTVAFVHGKYAATLEINEYNNKENGLESEGNWVRTGTFEMQVNIETSSLSLSADGTKLVVGTIGPSVHEMQVYTFTDNEWSMRVQEKGMVDSLSKDDFGKSVAISYDGSYIAAGAPEVSGTVSSGPGYVWLYDFIKE